MLVTCTFNGGRETAQVLLKNLVLKINQRLMCLKWHEGELMMTEFNFGVNYLFQYVALLL